MSERADTGIRPVRDGYGRRITYLRLSVTDRCNLRCRYCMPADGVPMLRHRDILSFEEMREVVAAAVSLGVTKVRLTGGEPLVRRGIVDLVRMLAAVPGIAEVDMTTNGTLLSPTAADLRAAGLSRVNVSLDTLDPERYARITRGGRLEDARAGLRAALDAGFERVKVNCVLAGGFNDDEVPRLAGLARDLPVEVRFIELMPLGPSADWPQGCFVPAERVLDALPEAVRVGPGCRVPLCVPAVATEASADPGVAELYQVPGWVGCIGLIRPMGHRFCRQCNRVRVTSDGMLKPCLHSAAEIPLRGLHGEALVDAIRRGIEAKPEGHHMDTSQDERAVSQSARAMNEIGG